MSPELDMDGIFDRVPRALARAITVLESDNPAKRGLIEQVYGRLGHARLLGITGPPGAGKSTLLARVCEAIRDQQQTVAVLAIDPTSPFTGGALLGDRVRMQKLYTDRGVYIRSMATRGAMGGVARATRDSVDLLDAAGFDWVIVETVGVGQDEVDVVRTVDSVLVVTVPGLGDEIQAIKAGIMEIADVFVINKSDLPGADRTLRDLEAMLAMAENLDWRPPIVQTVATHSEGVTELLDRVEQHAHWLGEGDRLRERRFQQLRLRVEILLKERILAAADHSEGIEAFLRSGHSRGTDPYTLAESLFEGALIGSAEET